MGKYNDGKTHQAPRNKYKKKKHALSTRQLIEVRTIAKQAAMDVPEKKHLDQAVNGLAIQRSAASPVAVDLTPISQGDGENQRVGNHVTPLYLGGRYTITQNGAATQRNVLTRLVVIQYLANTNELSPTNPDIGFVLQDPSRPFGFYNMNKASQWKVIYDAKHAMSSTPSSENFSVYGEFNIDLRKNMHIDFNDTNTTGSGKYYVLAVSSGLTANDYPILQMDTRLKYIDA